MVWRHFYDDHGCHTTKRPISTYAISWFARNFQRSNVLRLNEKEDSSKAGTNLEVTKAGVWCKVAKVSSRYGPFAYFSNSLISGESMVITIELWWQSFEAFDNNWDPSLVNLYSKVQKIVIGQIVTRPWGQKAIVKDHEEFAMSVTEAKAKHTVRVTDIGPTSRPNISN